MKNKKKCPTCSKLNMVFEFKHEGRKKKDEGAAQA